MSHTETRPAEPTDDKPADGEANGWIIHDIQPQVSTAPATPKPKPVTGVNIGTPIEAGIDLVNEVLDYLTDPNTPPL